MFNVYVRAFLYIENNTILLLRHCTESFGYGLYGMIGGTINSDERALDAVQRKIFEEVGLDISKKELAFAHALHRTSLEKQIVLLCFKANISMLQKPYNKQPNKHDQLLVCPINELPQNISLAHKQIIECISNNIIYSEFV